VLINGKDAKLEWPKDAPSKKLPIDQEVYPVLSFPKGIHGLVQLQGRSGIGLSFAEQALRKKLQQQVFEAMAGGKVVAARLAFDAVEKGNLALLRTLAEYAPNVNAQMSADCLRTPTEAAVVSNNLGLLQELLTRASGSSEEPFPPNSISEEIHTGVAAAHTFNHRVGKIGAARGGKEGNGAFIAW
jgi:hypothetical protein